MGQLRSILFYMFILFVKIVLGMFENTEEHDNKAYTASSVICTGKKPDQAKYFGIWNLEKKEHHFDNLQRQKKLLKRKTEANSVCGKTKLRHYEGLTTCS